MRCRKARKLLSARFDGELDEPRELGVKEHLAVCPCCERFAGDLPRCAKALDLMTAPAPRAGFTARLIADLPNDRTKCVRLRDRLEALRLGPAAAAAVALFCGIVLALSMNGQQAAEVAGRMERAEAIYGESFDAVPGNSAAARYLALLQQSEK